MTIVVTGGGTGGHVTPLVAMLDAWRDFSKETGSDSRLSRLYYVGPVDRHTNVLCERHDITCIPIAAGKWRRYIALANITDIFIKLPWGCLRALVHLHRLKPAVVFSKGGFGSVPVIAAAVLLRIPFVLHESDAVPSLTTRLFARWARVLALAWSDARGAFEDLAVKRVVTGIPVRLDLLSPARTSGHSEFSLPPSLPVVLVLGGSQGARRINELVIPELPKLLPLASVILVSGVGEYEKCLAQVLKLHLSPAHLAGFKIFPWLGENLPAAYAVADIIIARAGATTLAEIAAVKKPSILIPLDSAANNHQQQNASIFSDAGASLVLRSQTLTSADFLEALITLLNDEQRRETMSRRAAQLARPDAARDVVALVSGVANQ